mmetsp:Transcript_38123/g.73218  ORF Transcript_38123/g.73218 Transcript_38123/m.73218 type:complete len:211 (-) Transcript_38123:143-775(-)
MLLQLEQQPFYLDNCAVLVDLDSCRNLLLATNCPVCDYNIWHPYVFLCLCLRYGHISCACRHHFRHSGISPTQCHYDVHCELVAPERHAKKILDINGEIDNLRAATKIRTHINRGGLVCHVDTRMLLPSLPFPKGPFLVLQDSNISWLHVRMLPLLLRHFGGFCPKERVVGWWANSARTHFVPHLQQGNAVCKIGGIKALHLPLKQGRLH